jgi:antitoxin PrlF
MCCNKEAKEKKCLRALDISAQNDYIDLSYYSEFSDLDDKENPMAKSRKDSKGPEGGSRSLNVGCCQIDALVTVDARGQLVLPKDLRDKLLIKAGDKLAVISMMRDNEICCITLVKADEFANTVKNMLGPMMKDILD